jgi:hypothetical protein
MTRIVEHAHGSPLDLLQGRGKQPCCKAPCPFRSVAGLKAGQGLCPYHWNEYANGKAWADKCHPDYATFAALARRLKENSTP